VKRNVENVSLIFGLKAAATVLKRSSLF